ncbi:unannotated protein [freshwater metagenome]|jgi:hypothetical protein|uniref:Unannotated protein n=1 Tax=freshwater metagenome TaxID=449393 RepID=A0A6J6ZKP2_9ZZZZ|nr:hypothetical protein [Actinomycetota bacterium]
MSNRLNVLLDKIKALEIELIAELQKQQREFSYEIIQRHVVFERNIKSKHKAYAKRLINYLFDAKLKHIISTPFIWMCIVPAVSMDITVSLYQAICFPLYNIPKVKRQDYIVFDRQYLDYLNIIEKFNCAYCSYINGLFGYLQEIGGRTEQFWCPIKHAKRINQLHSRYQKFIEYGDAKSYQVNHEAIRKDFKDL